MNIKVLLASFVVVFLAELGDKTQLTALAFSSQSRSPWAVFIGTSLALVCATALAVAFGEVLGRHVPARLLHLCSAVMFVLIGLVLLVNLARGTSAGPEADVSPEEQGQSGMGVEGAVSAFVGRQAVAFEEDMLALVEQTTATVAPGPIQQVLQRIAGRHREHIRAITGLGETIGEAGLKTLDAELARAAPGAIVADYARSANMDAENALITIMRRQEALAQFYIALGRMISLHGAKDTLRGLAMEEIRLANELCSLVNHDEETV